MSTDYYLACDRCGEQVIFWKRYAGPVGPAGDPEIIQSFLWRHIEHGIVVYDEHDTRYYRYRDPPKDSPPA